MAFLATTYERTAQYLKDVHDFKIIPDKHNTGIDSSVTLNVAQLSDPQTNLTIDGIVITCRPTDFIINAYGNAGAPREVTIENWDFSAGFFSLTNVEVFGKVIHITFKNCKFKGVSFYLKFDKTSGIQCTYNNCEFIGTLQGNNYTCNGCAIHEVQGDALNPSMEVYMNNCYIYNLLTEAQTTGTHVDGMQIFGQSGKVCHTVHFDNVRMELPSLHINDNSAYINACLMFKLERGSVNDTWFHDCTFNGGGFSIYLQVDSRFTQDDQILQNIGVGCFHKYGIFYANSFNQNAIIEKVEDITKLFVSSVWKENGVIHFLCTNDTLNARVLKAVTSSGTEYTFNMAQNYGYDYTQTNVSSFDELPIDVEFTINEDADYVVFYDTSVSEVNQIRFEDILSESNLST